MTHSVNKNNAEINVKARIYTHDLCCVCVQNVQQN